jgi:hypothetical protein
MENDKAMALQEQQRNQQQGGVLASSMPTLSHRTLPSSFTCLTLPDYSLADCNFVAQIQSARLQQRLLQQEQTASTNGRRSTGIPVQTYHSGFTRHDYPAAKATTEPLHIGVFSADLRPHPMLNLLRAFVKYASSSASKYTVKITLYHVSADPTILEEMKGYYRKQELGHRHDLMDVACTNQEWQECVIHARQNKVMVWLETTGQTGKLGRLNRG